jgi:hypothetical protein
VSGSRAGKRSGVSAHEAREDRGTGSAEANPCDLTPITDGSVSCIEYAQTGAELSRFLRSAPMLLGTHHGRCTEGAMIVEATLHV